VGGSDGGECRGEREGVQYLDDPCETEVGNFDDAILPDENVARGEVSVYVVLRLQVGHTGGDLSGDVYQLR